MKLCPTCQRCYDDTDAICSQDNVALVPSYHGPRLVVGKYLLKRLLGRGGMGAVYAGLHVDLDRPVAVKLLLPDLISDSEALERFRREALAAARLDHPNIADTYDYGMLPDGGAYIVMELVDGITLREYMNTDGALPTRVAVHLATQIAEAIEAAHAGGIVHRDLKPSNIVIRLDRDGLWEAKVVDFGVAKLKEQTTSANGGITSTGSLIGTPRYMSPEQCMGQRTDARSDIYSLGVILYEMLTGNPPFDAPTPTAIAIKHIQEAPPSSKEARPDLPEKLVQLMDQVLRKEPQARPQTAAEMAHSLREVAHELQGGDTALSGADSSLPSAEQRQPARTGGGPPTNPLISGPETQRSSHPTEESISGQHILQTLPMETETRASAQPEVHTTPQVESTARESLPDLPPQAAARPAEKRDDRASHENSGASGSPLLYILLAAATLLFVGIIFLLWPARSRQETEHAAPNSSQAGTTATPAPSVNTSEGAANHDGSSQPTSVKGGEASELRTLLSDWVAATNARDVKRQMAFYAPTLEAFYLQRNASRAAVRAEKERIFSQLTYVSVNTTEPEINLSDDGSTATLRFHKSWNFKGARAESGEVIQELRLRKMEGSWKIISERDLQKLR